MAESEKEDFQRESKVNGAIEIKHSHIRFPPETVAFNAVFVGLLAAVLGGACVYVIYSSADLSGGAALAFIALAIFCSAAIAGDKPPQVGMD